MSGKRVALYVRVSKRGQTVENQILELTAWAERCGHTIVRIYRDDAISGTKGRDKRPDFDRMLKDATRRLFDMVAAWSVDRLGRSLQDLVGFLADLQGAGLDLFLHQQALDTTTPSGKAMFQMCGIFAEFEVGMIKERIFAGLARARAAGRIGGRPRTAPEIEEAIRLTLATGQGILKTARQHKVASSVVQRIKAEMTSSADGQLSG